MARLNFEKKMPMATKQLQHVSPSPALRKLCEANDENEPTEQIKQEVIQELVETWEFGRAVNVNYTLDKAAVAGAAVNEKAVVEYLQARAQALCDMGLLDEQGMHAILQGRLQKRDSAYEDIENAVNAHWPPKKRNTTSKEMEPVANALPQPSIGDITNKMNPPKSYKDRRATIMALGDAFSQAYDNIIYQGKQSKLPKSVKKHLTSTQSKTKETPSATGHRNLQSTVNGNDDLRQSNYLHINDSNPNDLLQPHQNVSCPSSRTPRENRQPQLNTIENRQCCVLQ